MLTNKKIGSIIKYVPYKKRKEKVHWKINNKSFKRPSGNVNYQNNFEKKIMSQKLKKIFKRRNELYKKIKIKCDEIVHLYIEEHFKKIDKVEQSLLL